MGQRPYTEFMTLPVYPTPKNPTTKPALKADEPNVHLRGLVKNADWTQFTSGGSKPLN